MCLFWVAFLYIIMVKNKNKHKFFILIYHMKKYYLHFKMSYLTA